MSAAVQALEKKQVAGRTLKKAAKQKPLGVKKNNGIYGCASRALSKVQVPLIALPNTSLNTITHVPLGCETMFPSSNPLRIYCQTWSA